MHWIVLIHELYNLSWITEINELFHDILIYWDAPVGQHQIRKHKVFCKCFMPHWGSLIKNTSHFCFLFIEGVGAEHLSDSLERSSERKHELFKLVLILTCQRHRKSLKMSFYMMLIWYIFWYTLTQIYHKKSSQGCVESGPTSHVTEVGLIVHTQERKVLTLPHRRKTGHLSALESYSQN